MVNFVFKFNVIVFFFSVYFLKVVIYRLSIFMLEFRVRIVEIEKLLKIIIKIKKYV